MRTLYHITTREQADIGCRGGVYAPQTLRTEGFAHCSFIEQLPGVANAFFQGQENLVVLEIEPTRVDSEVRVENLIGGDTLFPHVYGRIPWASVSAVHNLPSTDGGLFEMPGTIIRKSQRAET